jgi:hypothetical protein
MAEAADGRDKAAEGRRHHDMGGLEAGPLDLAEHDYAPWEKKVDAIVRLLIAKDDMTLDEMRRGIEELGPEDYERLSYFERWISSVANVMLEKGVVTVAELGEAIELAKERHRAQGGEA